MIKKIKKIPQGKSTYDEFIESLTPQKRKAFEEEYKDLLLSEMILAAMQEDHVSVRELARLAGVSPTIIQGIRTGKRKNFSTQSFFKILKGLGCSFFIERHGHIISLDISTRSQK